MSRRIRTIALATGLLWAACAPRESEQVAVGDTATDTATVIDEHAGHHVDTQLDTTPDDPHAGHGAPAASTDAHARHAAPATAADPHATHRAQAPARAGAPDPHAAHARQPASARDQHAGHTAPAPRGTDPHAAHAPAAPRQPDAHAGHAAAAPGAAHTPVAADGAHDKLMLLVRSLLVEPAVQRRITADSTLHRLWNDQAVREHILSNDHEH
jgi:hypothetical protein